MEATAKRNLAEGDPVYADDIDVPESSLKSLFKSSIDEGEVADYMGVEHEEDVIIQHETTENGAGDSMVFEFERAEAVELDPVDREIDDILHGGKQ